MTRFIWTLAFLALAFTNDPLASDGVVFDPHIRSNEPELLDAVADGARLSPTLRQLVDRLGASDVVVYLTSDRSPSPRTAGHLSLLAAVTGHRYLRVSIDRRYAGCQRIAILGHELHHAVEIADSRSVTDDTTLAALYRRIGFESAGPDREWFESAGAILAGRMIEKELQASGRYTEFTRRSWSR
jgi:hypothetical protein